MLKTPQKFRLIDENKETEFFAEVNWSNDPKLNDCKMVKFTFPDGKTALVKKEHLLGMIFTMGTESEQVKMVPQKNTTVRWYTTTLGITATKDIKKGETINVPVKLSLPSEEEEIIAELNNKIPTA